MKTYSVVIISMIFAIFFLLCKKDSSSYKVVDTDVFSKLEISFLDGFGYSDLMPVIPPDPVSISFRLAIKNLSNCDTIRQLNFENCRVYLTTDSLLGMIEITPWEEIKLLPLKTDTIEFGKIQDSTRILDPPCNKNIYLTFDIKDRYNNHINFQTDRIFYRCVY